LDWLSRIEGKVWRNKPMLLLSASPGIRGGKSVLDIALGKFPFMGANIIGNMPFPLYAENFKEGEIVNAELKKALVKLVKEFEKAL
jgi:NAD(P)H-dependent FMN reductase